MTITEALDQIDQIRKSNQGEIATDAASDALNTIIKHWRDVADHWGGDGLTGLKFKVSFVGDLNDVIANLTHLREEAIKVVAKVPESHVHGK